MKPIDPKDFIKEVLIKEIEEIHSEHPYISFAIMAIGIEFLGKCLNGYDDWNFWKVGQPRKDFEYPINNLSALSRYKPYLTSYSLWDALRNGFTHSFVPKKTITLSSKDEMPHMKLHNRKLNLKCEDFYNDFKAACEEVLGMDFPEDNKMNRPLLIVPDDPQKPIDSNPEVPKKSNFPNIESIVNNPTAVTITASTSNFNLNDYK